MHYCKWYLITKSKSTFDRDTNIPDTRFIKQRKWKLRGEVLYKEENYISHKTTNYLKKDNLVFEWEEQ